MFLCGLWFGVMSMPLQRKASLKIKNIKNNNQPIIIVTKLEGCQGYGLRGI